MKITKNFINEFFKLCLKKKQLLEIAKKHMKYTYLPSEEYKEIWQTMIQYQDDTDKLITIGILTQQLSSKANTLKIINEIKNADDLSAEEGLKQLEIFCRNKLFIDGYETLGDLFNEGKKEEAFDQMSKIADSLTDFRIVEKNLDVRIIQDIIDRQKQRVDLADSQAIIHIKKNKIPTGITPLDMNLRGGVDRGDTLLILADSGVGKSKCLKHMGLSAARVGFRVVHIQAEGTKKEAEEAYDAAIMGMNVEQLSLTNLSPQLINQLSNIQDQINSSGGEIHLKAFEQFDEANIFEVKQFVEHIELTYGAVDLLLLDYIDECDPGDQKRYSGSQDGERQRRRATSKKFKNVCVEHNCAGATATQANDIKDILKEDPDFVLKRGNTSENRKLLQPYSYLITLNQTSEEQEGNVMRLYIDKIRKYKPIKRLMHIKTLFENERFYDHKSTVENFG